MGLIFMTRVPMKVAMNSATLMQNCHGFSAKDEKLSLFINNRAAAASSPTTAGRSVLNTLFTMGVSMYLRNILAMSTMRMNDGRMSAPVAVMLPRTAIVSLMPAFLMAV